MALDYKAMFAEQLTLQKKLKEDRAKAEKKSEKSAPQQEPDLKLASVDFVASAVKGAEQSVFYFSNFISPNYAKELERAVQECPWTQLPKRKLQNHGGVPHPSGTILEPLPEYVDKLADLLHARGVFEKKPNQALVNEYEAGSGIDFHYDGPNFEPVAAIVSLLSPAVIHFRSPKEDRIEHSVLLEPNSLLVFKGYAYTDLKHGILAAKEDQVSLMNLANANLLGTSRPEIVRRERRISLTMRNVSKVQYTMESSTEVLPPRLEEERQRRHRWWRSAIADR